jgi:hypothetical protein
MKKNKFIIALAFVGLVFTSCSANDHYASDKTDNMIPAEEISSAAAYADDNLAQKKESSEGVETDQSIKDPVLLIRNGSISFNTKDMSSTVYQVRALNRQFNNTVFSEDQSENQYARWSNFSIGVDPKVFDTYLDSLDKIVVSYTNKTISGQDVTDEVIDVRSRIKTKKVVLGRYIELLEKARGIDEVLRLEREVGMIQEEIESTEARYGSLMHRVNMSKLEISIHQELKPQEPDTFKEDMLDAFGDGTDGVKNAIVGILYIWPFLILSIIVLIWLLYKKKQWAKKKAETKKN